jgi:uncharacterized protein YdaU (DUF1376 family)
MSAPASIPIFGDAYLADTQHLTLEEHGAYFKLLLCAWRTSNCELPADDRRIATMLGISAGKWAKLRPAVIAFWTRTETGWEQKRLSKERKFVEEKRAKNILAAEASWSGKSRKSNKHGDADAIANAMPLSPPPSKKEKTLPNGSAKKIDDGDSSRPVFRGCRLPSDWKPDELPSNMHPPPGLVEAEADKFRDYWTAQPGQKGVKLDWQATWRNWMRKAMEQNNGQRMATGNRAGTQPQPQYRAQPGWELFKSLRGRGDTGELDDDGSSGLRSRGVLSALEMPGQD